MLHTVRYKLSQNRHQYEKCCYISADGTIRSELEFLKRSGILKAEKYAGKTYGKSTDSYRKQGCTNFLNKKLRATPNFHTKNPQTLGATVKKTSLHGELAAEICAPLIVLFI
jgi:hypothetical protein